MLDWQEILIAIFGIYSFIGFVKGFIECKYKKNSYGQSPLFFFNGSFVWADQVIFGLFWTIVSATILFLNDWILFLLITSCFWFIRGFGETIYWFNQQFSTVNRNPVDRFPFLKSIFHNDSVWFVFQIYWQCITVIALVFTIYFAKIWF